MIQTTLFNYFNCSNNSESPKQIQYKPFSFKQTNFNHFKIIPKKRTLLDYFKSKEKSKK